MQAMTYVANILDNHDKQARDKAQYHDAWHNDTRHKGLKCDTVSAALCITIMSHYDEYHHGEYHIIDVLSTDTLNVVVLSIMMPQKNI